VSRVPDGGDPNGQFRGWAHPHIRGEVEREVIRLRNGGTYNTRSEKGKQKVQVVPLPRCQNCAEVTLAARPDWADDE
jgi:hypothetical protein